MHERLAVYVPNEKNPLHATLPRGTALIGKRVVPDDDESPVYIDYEEPGDAINVRNFADRCMIAGGRSRDDAPSHKKLLARPDQVTQVAWYHPWHRRVELADVAPPGRHGNIDWRAVNLVRLSRWINGEEGKLDQAELIETRPRFVGQD